jgi:hypothetical protein
MEIGRVLTFSHHFSHRRCGIFRRRNRKAGGYDREISERYKWRQIRGINGECRACKMFTINILGMDSRARCRLPSCENVRLLSAFCSHKKNIFLRRASGWMFAHGHQHVQYPSFNAGCIQPGCQARMPGLHLGRGAGRRGPTGFGFTFSNGCLESFFIREANIEETAQPPKKSEKGPT